MTRRRELEPPTYLLHACAEPGCKALGFAARCERHASDGDRERLVAMDRAILHAAQLEEAWLEARRAALAAERAAGVRRAQAQ